MKIIEEKWVGVGWAAEKGEQQRVSPEGFPMMKPDGSPDMEPITILVFVHTLPDGQHIVRVPMDESAKAKLLEKLTGGVVVASGFSDGMKLH